MQLKFSSIRWIILIIIGSSTQTFAQKGDLKLEDIWGSSLFISRSVPGFNAMKDGESYTTSVQTENGQAIVRYNIKTGKATDTIVKPFQLINKKDTIEFDVYSFSADEKKILFSSNSEAIYRHSSREDYFVLVIIS